MTTQQAKDVDMVDYLFWIGDEPQKILRNSYWYLSPLRNEKTPSFKVNRSVNRWYDFAEGKGGNLVDFGTRITSAVLVIFYKNWRHQASNLPAAKNLRRAIS